MRHSGGLKRARLWAAVVALALVNMPPAARDAGAQGIANGTRFGDWVVACEAMGVNQTICGLKQHVSRSADGQFIAEFLGLWTQDGTQRYLLARVPLGVHFPSGLTIGTRDQEERLQFVWQACNQQVCEALLMLDEEMIGRLESGDAPQIVAFRPGMGREPVFFELKTNGLGEGLAALRPGAGR